MDVQKQDDQHELTYSNYVRTQDVTQKTCRRRWMIGRSGERGSGISVLAVRHDDDDDDDVRLLFENPTQNSIRDEVSLYNSMPVSVGYLMPNPSL